MNFSNQHQILYFPECNLAPWGQHRRNVRKVSRQSPVISGNLNVLFKAEKHRRIKTFWLRCIFCFAVTVNKNFCKFASPEKNDDGKTQAKPDRWIMGELIKLISRSTENKMDV